MERPASSREILDDRLNGGVPGLTGLYGQSSKLPPFFRDCAVGAHRARPAKREQARKQTLFFPRRRDNTLKVVTLAFRPLEARPRRLKSPLNRVIRHHACIVTVRRH